MPTIDVERDHLDILQNIEFAIVSIYQGNPSLMDANVDSALESLGRTYAGETRGRKPVIPTNPVTRIVYDRVQAICDWRLGRNPLENEEGQPGPVPEAVSVEIILACLKRIRKSLRLWTKESGRQGYLNYIDQFM